MHRKGPPASSSHLLLIYVQMSVLELLLCFVEGNPNTDTVSYIASKLEWEKVKEHKDEEAKFTFTEAYSRAPSHSQENKRPWDSHTASMHLDGTVNDHDYNEIQYIFDEWLDRCVFLLGQRHFFFLCLFDWAD